MSDKNPSATHPTRTPGMHASPHRDDDSESASDAHTDTSRGRERVGTDADDALNAEDVMRMQVAESMRERSESTAVCIAHIAEVTLR